MYLLYFRFDDQGKVVTMHVRCESVSTSKQILDMAKQHGLTASAKLVEYASFGAGSTIQPRTVPNFHYYHENDFREQWQQGKSR